MKQFVWFPEGDRASPYITQFVVSIHAQGFQDNYPATAAASSSSSSSSHAF